MRVHERISSEELTASASSMTLEMLPSRDGTRPRVAFAARMRSWEGGADPAAAAARRAPVSYSALRRSATARSRTRSRSFGG